MAPEDAAREEDFRGKLLQELQDIVTALVSIGETLKRIEKFSEGPTR